MSSRPRTSAGGERRWFWVCFLALALGFAGLATLTYLGLPSFLAPRLSPELTELREGRLRDWHEVYGRTSVYEKGTHLIRYQFHVDPFPETFSLQGSGLAGDAQALKLAPGTPDYSPGPSARSAGRPAKDCKQRMKRSRLRPDEPGGSATYYASGRRVHRLRVLAQVQPLLLLLRPDPDGDDRVADMVEQV